MDHEIAQRHKLRHISVLNDEGRIVNAGPEFDVSRNIVITEHVDLCNLTAKLSSLTANEQLLCCLNGGNGEVRQVTQNVPLHSKKLGQSINSKRPTLCLI